MGLILQKLGQKELWGQDQGKQQNNILVGSELLDQVWPIRNYSKWKWIRIMGINNTW